MLSSFTGHRCSSGRTNILRGCLLSNTPAKRQSLIQLTCFTPFCQWNMVLRLFLFMRSLNICCQAGMNCAVIIREVLASRLLSSFKIEENCSSTAPHFSSFPRDRARCHFGLQFDVSNSNDDMPLNALCTICGFAY